MKAYWLGLLYALLSASVSYFTANGLAPSSSEKPKERPLSEQDYRDWYNRDHNMSGVFTLNRTAGNHILIDAGSRRCV